jgi:hypothetical protein
MDRKFEVAVHNNSKVLDRVTDRNDTGSKTVGTRLGISLLMNIQNGTFLVDIFNCQSLDHLLSESRLV